MPGIALASGRVVLRRRPDRARRALDRPGVGGVRTGRARRALGAPDAAGVRAGLAERGIAVRAFAGRPDLDDCLRITCPGDDRAFARLCAALQEVVPNLEIRS